MSIEAFRNQQHREALRVIYRLTRRIPCIVDAYNGSQHTVKVKRQPEGTLTGWHQIQTLQIGLLIAPNVGDPGWLEFHDGDTRAPVFVGSNHNDQNPPPKEIQAGELYYQKNGVSVYVKQDGSATLIDKANSTVALDGAGNVNVTAATQIKLQAPVIVLDGSIWFEGNVYGAAGAGVLTLGVPLNQVAGGITTVGDVISSNISLDNHIHSVPEGGETGPPTG